MTNREKIDRQREHQANERTFLAWLRTSISLIAFGFAIARFGLFLRQLEVAVTGKLEPFHPNFNSQILGIILVIFGIAVIALAAWRYNQVFWQIERGDFRPNRWIVWLLTFVVMVLGILSMPLLLVWREIADPSTKPNPLLPSSFQRIETERNNYYSRHKKR
jgi:putative membrane protein